GPEPTVVNVQPDPPLSPQQDYRSELEIYSIEAQQIWQTPRQTMVVGTRFQDGTFDTRNREENFQVFFLDFFPDRVIADQHASVGFERWSLYGYEQWQVTDSLRLVGGLTYERLVAPENHRFAPIS